MLTQRTKIIILIAGAVVVMGLVVLMVWDFSPEKEVKAPPGATEDLSFLENKDVVTGTEFDASNKDAFDQSLGNGVAGETISPLEQEARSLAIFFVERFGTYSSDANFANIDDLKTFMTEGMRRWSDRYKQNQPQPDVYSLLATEVASLATNSFVLAERRAVFDIITSRTESKNGSSESYQQKAKLELSQDGSGTWLVSSLYWGERL